MVLIGVPPEWMPCPMMEGMYAVPQEGHHMQGSMHPIHAEGQQVMIADESQGALMPWRRPLR
eukprot:3887305-Amphidinium_carterae.1